MQKRELFTKNRLFCPGPTPVPESVRAALTETSIYHRSDEFYTLFRECAVGLAPIFGSKNIPVILTASGTGAMEAAVVNLTATGDRVTVVNGGKFGERWEKLTNAYGCVVDCVPVPWGQAPTAAKVLSSLKPDTKAIFLQANETSTGAYYQIENLIPEIRKTYKGMIIVDGISSLCAHEMRMDEWGIDAVVAGSQKGFGLPPGLAFISLSDRAWDNLSDRPRFYFDLEKERAGQLMGQSAWTPAASLIIGLRSALATIQSSGLQEMYDHHSRLAKATRNFATAVNLDLLCAENPSHSLTTMVIPADVDSGAIVKTLREKYGAFFAGGQDQLKGKVIRFAHLGFVNMLEVIAGLAALEFTLKEHGHKFEFGNGVKAAMESLQSG